MKKIILGAFVLATALFNKEAAAQSFTIEKDTVKYVLYGFADIHNKITNTGSTPMTVNWRVIDHTLPISWQEGAGICDNVTCYTGGVLGQSASTPAAPPYTPPGNMLETDTFSGILDFKLQMGVGSAVTGGPFYITIEVSEGTTTDTMTFAMYKYATNVNKTVKSDNNITIYPNPARSEVNVLFDANSDIRNIAVYNLIGKPVSVYRVSNGSAKLDIDNIPAGIYFMRFVDGTGKIVATRKFTHQ